MAFECVRYIVGSVYALIVLIFGVLQVKLLVGNLHWLIETLHLLVGIGAIALTGLLGALQDPEARRG